MTSRSEALKAIERKFDGFDVREEWDVTERIEATLQACGYMDLFEVILDAVTENNHLHFADECRKGSKRIRSARQAKNVSDRRAGELAEENRVLASIVRDLAALPGPYNSEYMYCELCSKQVDLHADDDGEVDTSLESHAESCPWRRARAWLASQEPTQ